MGSYSVMFLNLCKHGFFNTLINGVPITPTSDVQTLLRGASMFSQNVTEGVSGTKWAPTYFQGCPSLISNWHAKCLLRNSQMCTRKSVHPLPEKIGLSSLRRIIYTYIVLPTYVLTYFFRVGVRIPNFSLVIAMFSLYGTIHKPRSHLGGWGFPKNHRHFCVQSKLNT